jgi:MFS family permease
MIGESCNEENRAQAYAMYSSFGNVSILLAPLIGGLLAKPAQRFEWLAKSRLFTTYPYALPSMFMGALGILTTALCAAFIKEVRLLPDEMN